MNRFAQPSIPKMVELWSFQGPCIVVNQNPCAFFHLCPSILQCPSNRPDILEVSHIPMALTAELLIL